MIGEADVAVVAPWHPTALPAFHHRGKATPVLEQNHLFALFESLPHRAQQLGRERPVHHLPSLQVLDIDHLYLRQLYILIAGGQTHESVFARHSIIVAFHRGGRCAQHNLRVIIGAGRKLRGHHNGRIAGMIARGRILLLERSFVLLIYDDESQPLEGQEQRRTGTKNHLIGIG